MDGSSSNGDDDDDDDELVDVDNDEVDVEVTTDAVVDFLLHDDDKDVDNAFEFPNICLLI